MSNNKPSFIVYAVKDGKKKGDKGIWTRVGALWPTENGEGYVQTLDFIPTFTSRFVILPPKADDAEESEA